MPMPKVIEGGKLKLRTQYLVNARKNLKYDPSFNLTADW